jgi:hypothetical protein
MIRNIPYPDQKTVKTANLKLHTFSSLPEHQEKLYARQEALSQKERFDRETTV